MEFAIDCKRKIEMVPNDVFPRFEPSFLEHRDAFMSAQHLCLAIGEVSYRDESLLL